MRTAALVLLLTSSPFAGAADEAALIRQIQALLSSNELIAGEFSQSIKIAALSRPIVSSGRFYFQEAEGIAWYVDQPLQSSVFIDEHGTLQGSADTAHTQPPGMQSGMGWIADLTRALLLGDLEHLSGLFGLEGESDGANWSIRMTPKAELLKKLFERIDMTGANTVQDIVLHTTTADRIDIQFLNVRAIPELPPSVAADMGASAN